MLNLKRFTVDSQGTAANVKLNDYLSFPMVLDMAPYTQGVEMCDDSIDGDDGGAHLLYQLVGVIVHKGEASHGHYYSLMKHHANGTWYKVGPEAQTHGSAKVSSHPRRSDQSPGRPDLEALRITRFSPGFAPPGTLLRILNTHAPGSFMLPRENPPWEPF